MTKHITDQARPRGNARLTRYVQLEQRERLNGPHPVIEALERRPGATSSETRAKAFLKIDARAE